MSDSENDSSSESLQHDLMSVSDQEGDASRDEDDMPSAEVDLSEGAEQIASRDEDSIPTDSTSNEDLAQLHGAVGLEAADLLESQVPVGDLDEAAVKIFLIIFLGSPITCFYQ